MKVGNGRSRAARWLARTGASTVLVELNKRRTTGGLTVLTYHRVSTTKEARDSPFDREVIDATCESFAEHLRVLSERCSFVGIAELEQALLGASLPPNPVMLTFDDGYRDCVRFALPVLRRYRARAVFFVATDFIEHRRMFWWDSLSYLLRSSRRQVLDLRYPYPLRIPLDNRERAIALLCRMVKQGFRLDVDRFVGNVAQAADVPWDRDLQGVLANQLIMDWDDVANLKSAGMDVQSHTRTHLPLEVMAPDQLEGELVGARTDLESKFGGQVRALAYPIGARIANRPDLRAVVEKAGYSMGFSNGSGVQRFLSPEHSLDLRRVAVDRQLGAQDLESILAVPGLAHVSVRNR